MEKSEQNEAWEVTVSDDDYTKLPANADEVHSEKKTTGAPWFVWPLLAICLVASSSSGAIMKQMELKHAGAVSLAGWRFQVMAIILVPCFLWQWAFMTPQARAKLYQTANIGHIFLSGIGLAAFFSLWNWSLQHTSLTHSLFLSSMWPIYVALGAVLTGGRITKAECSGVILGIVGSLILAVGTQAEPGKEATLVGDLIAFLAAGGFALYLVASYTCRVSMPVYIYMFPSTLSVAVILGILGALVEGSEPWRMGGAAAAGTISGPFGWFATEEFLLWTSFLEIVPGFLSYIGFNIVLAFQSSLVVSMGQAVCPLTGSFLGWLMDLADSPILYTCIGGALIMFATSIVSWTSQHHGVKQEDFDKMLPAMTIDKQIKAKEPLL